MNEEGAELDSKQLCTFYVDRLLFGVEVTNVQEVLRYQEITPVPLSPPAVRGLINLRGQIVSAVDMRVRLGIAPLPAERTPMNVVIRHNQSGAVTLLVDEIGDVVDVDDSSFESPPATLDKLTRALVSGVYKLESQLLLLLDTHAAVRADSPIRVEGNDNG